MRLFHLTAIMRWPYQLLADPDHAAWTWRHLRQAFPGAVAVALMPDHPHLLVPGSDGGLLRARLARTLGQLQRGVGVSDLWTVLPVTEVQRDKAPRVARYIELNPSRGGLVDTPLRWPWSTLRDRVGATVEATVNPWVTEATLGRWLPRLGDVSSWLDYVLADDTVEDRAVPLPAANTAEHPRFGIEAVAQAACAALRVQPAALWVRGPARALFVALAVDQGHRDSSLLAGWCGVDERTVRKAVRNARRREPMPGLAAARLCLADPRLRWWPPSGQGVRRAAARPLDPGESGSMQSKGPRTAIGGS